MSWLNIAHSYRSDQAFKISFFLIYLPAWLYALYRWLLPKPLPGIPFNPEAVKSIWGDVLELRDDPSGLAKWCSKQLERHGLPVCQALMGPLSKPVVLVADVGNAREMLMGRSDFDRSAYIIDRFPLFGEFHLNMKTGDSWRESRGWLKDLLAPQYLHNVAGPAIHSSMLKLIKIWESKSRISNGRVFSMISDLKTLALDVIVAFHFGADFQDSALDRQVEFIDKLDGTERHYGQHNEIIFPNAPLPEFQQGLTDVDDKMAAIYTTKFPPSLVSWWARYMSPHYRPFFEAKDNFIRKHIDLALHRWRKNEDATTGIDHMVYREAKAAHKRQREPVFGKQIMVDEAYGNLIAGQHTTSAALVWILKLLADYPDVQAKLRQHLRTAFAGPMEDDRLPTAAEIINTKLPYLDAVLEEVLRLRAAMLVPRGATRDTELLGYPIPKDTVVLLVCQGPDYKPLPPSKYWSDVKASRVYPGKGNPDLEIFDPGRWLVRDDNGNTKFDGSSYPQLAFGLGIRACWGRRLAMLEMRIMTTLMILKFDLKDVPKELAGHEASYDISYRAKKSVPAFEKLSWAHVNFDPRWLNKR